MTLLQIVSYLKILLNFLNLDTKFALVKSIRIIRKFTLSTDIIIPVTVVAYRHLFCLILSETIFSDVIVTQDTFIAKLCSINEIIFQLGRETLSALQKLRIVGIFNFLTLINGYFFTFLNIITSIFIETFLALFDLNNYIIII